MSSSSVYPAAERCDSPSRNDPNAYASMRSTYKISVDQAAYPYAIVCTRCKNCVARSEDVFSLSGFGPSKEFANEGLIGVVRAIGVELEHPDLPPPATNSTNFRAKYVRCTECTDTVGKFIESLESEVLFFLLWKAAVEIEVNS